MGKRRRPWKGGVKSITNIVFSLTLFGGICRLSVQPRQGTLDDSRPPAYGYEVLYQITDIPLSMRLNPSITSYNSHFQRTMSRYGQGTHFLFNSPFFIGLLLSSVHHLVGYLGHSGTPRPQPPLMQHYLPRASPKEQRRGAIDHSLFPLSQTHRTGLEVSLARCDATCSQQV